MDKPQMETLSVKNAIERTVHGFIVSYSTVANTGNNASEQFFSAVDRYVAALYASGQIDSNYLLRSTSIGDLQVSFTTLNHHSNVLFILPPALRWKDEQNIEINTPAPIAEERPIVRFDACTDVKINEPHKTLTELINQQIAIMSNKVDSSIITDDHFSQEYAASFDTKVGSRLCAKSEPQSDRENAIAYKKSHDAWTAYCKQNLPNDTQSPHEIFIDECDKVIAAAELLLQKEDANIAYDRAMKFIK